MINSNISGTDKVIFTSVSGNGNYAVTSSLNHILTLWDLKNHRAKIVANDVAIALFAKNSNTFIWRSSKECKAYRVEVNDDTIRIYQDLTGVQNGGTLDYSRYDVARDDNVNIYLQDTNQNVAVNFSIDSPGGKYTVENDESGVNVLNGETGHKLFRLNKLSKKTLASQRISSLDNNSLPINQSSIALKFIDDSHYLRFLAYAPLAILYNIKSAKPIKYLYLGDSPYPSVARFHVDETIDTAPQLHFLVTGQYNANGIILYQYDTKAQKLNRIWEPHAPNSCSWTAI